MKLTSTAFLDGELIPKRYGMDFENINPTLTIHDVPDGTVSFVLILEDPDIPEAAGVPIWDHWVVFNIPSTVRQISEKWIVEGTRGIGTRNKLDYLGPRPPDREHRYFFRVYALDCMLDLPEGSNKQSILEKSLGHILATAELMGRFAPSFL